MDQERNRAEIFGGAGVLPIMGEDLVLLRDGRMLLDGVTVSIEPRSCVTVILGPNGAGKSLLIRTLAGLVQADSGRVTWGGREPGRDRAQRVGFVLQRPVLLRRSALENLTFALVACGRDRAAARALAAERLAEQGLGHVAHTRAQDLSGGEQQRLAVLRALLLEPEVIFLDEPAANLDPASTLWIEKQLAAAVARGLHVVLVTHDLAQARRVADEVIFLHKGRVVERADAADFFRAPATAAARAFTAGELVL